MGIDLKNNECALNKKVLVLSGRYRSISSAAGAGCAIDVGDFVHSSTCLGREVVELGEAYGRVTLCVGPRHR